MHGRTLGAERFLQPEGSGEPWASPTSKQQILLSDLSVQQNFKNELFENGADRYVYFKLPVGPDKFENAVLLKLIKTKEHFRILSSGLLFSKRPEYNHLF